MEVLPELKQVLLRYLDRVELWKLGSAMSTVDTTDGPLLLAAKPACLLRLDLKPGQIVLCAAVSRNGHFIAYSSQDSLRFFTFNLVITIIFK